MRPEPCPHCKNDVPIQQMQVSTEEFTFQQNQSLTCIMLKVIVLGLVLGPEQKQAFGMWMDILGMLDHVT